ncbi:tetratricopeptide repeat protein [Pendulispora rubella]|uniref:Tetratricopeptide repeat protein n=1 Tax=Pendulispora rubella TaxID=2741070 RepID=A0ABZ2KVF2_9BACT
MGYYWTYYLVIMFAAYAAENPWVCLVVVLFFALRRFLPDPVAIARNLGRIGRLRAQAELNAANAVARRDLGRSYLELRMPRTALKYLDQAAVIDPKNRDVAYLRGKALLRAGRPEEALAALGISLGIDPETGEFRSAASHQGAANASMRDGDAYLAAAEALERLERWEQMAEVLSAAARCNMSSLEALVRLARVRHRLHDEKGAREALDEARRTWRQLPRFSRRGQFAWWLRAQLGRFVLP